MRPASPAPEGQQAATNTKGDTAKHEKSGIMIAGRDTETQPKYKTEFPAIPTVGEQRQGPCTLEVTMRVIRT